MAKKKRADTQDTIAELNIKFTAETDELKRGLETVKSQLEDVQSSTKNTKSAFYSLSQGFKVMSASYIGKQLLSIGYDSIQMAMDVEESENLFNVSLGNMASKAREWSEDVATSLGLNAYSLREQVGTLYNMTTSMGLAADTAYDLSTTMTGLAYDMASFYNLETEEAFTKLRSGLTGEAEPLKAIGILVDENTIKQAAYRHGVAETGEELTQQQKVIARYLAILDQTSNAQGDMARTMDSPANQVRRMKEEFNQAAIALGQSLLPVVKTVLPYVTALAQVAADALGSVSSLTGTTEEMTTISSNFDVSNVSSSLEGITEDAEAAESALKGATVGLDELNVLGSNSDVDAGDTTISGSYSYDLTGSGYDLLGDLEESSDDAYGKVKSWLEGIKPLAEDIGIALLAIGGVKVINGISTLGENLKPLAINLKKTWDNSGKLTKSLIGVGGLVLAAKSSYDMVYKLEKGTESLSDTLIGIAGAGGGIAIATAAFGPYGGLAGAIATATGAISGAVVAGEEMKNEFVTAAFFDERGESIEYMAEATKEAWEYMSSYAGEQAGYRQEIDETSETINDVKNSINNLVARSKVASDEEYPEIIDNIKAEFEKMRQAAEDNIAGKTNSVICLLEAVKVEADERTSAAIDGLITKFNMLQQLLGNQIGNEQATVNKLLSEAASGAKLTDEQQKQLQDSMDKLMSYTATDGMSQATTAFDIHQQELESVDFGADLDEAKKMLEDYINLYSDTRENIVNSYADSLSSIEGLRKAYSTSEMREAAANAGIDVDTTIAEAKAEADKYYEQSLAALAEDREKIYTKLLDAYNQKVENAATEYAEERLDARYGADAPMSFYKHFQSSEEDKQAYYDEMFAEGIERAKTQYGNDITSLLSDLKGYEGGGYPEKAEVFYAREDGIPELVGRIGSRTAVANNMQITEGISDAVYRAFVSANMNNDGGTPVIIQLVDASGNVKSETYISTAERKNLRDGKVTIPIGG